MVAPFCPISRGQPKIDSPGPGGLPGTPRVLLPSIPIATDLPSLIRAVNIINDILRNITTSLTVNNTYYPKLPRPPKIPGKREYKMSPYPSWYQVRTETETGYVYYKSKDNPPDDQQRAHIQRTKEVEFRNRQLDADRAFIWRFTKPLDAYEGERGEGPLFIESFFERVINVHWAGGLAVDFGEHSADSTIKNEKQ